MLSLITEPARGYDPFLEDNPPAIWTFAGRLLGLGIQVNGGASTLDDIAEEAEMMELPHLKVDSINEVATALQESAYLLDYLHLRDKSASPADIAASSRKLWDATKDQDIPAALALLRSCLRHRNPAVRTAAAISLLPLTQEEETRFHVTGIETQAISSILGSAGASSDPGVRELGVAATGITPPPSMAGAAPKQLGVPSVSFIVHGTAAYSNDWWRRGGEFHQYLLDGPKPNIYNDHSPWDWSGSIRDRDRRTAARRFAEWSIKEKGVRRYDALIGHSYGGAVILYATQYGVEADAVILLSTPARQYDPEWSNVGFCKSLRLKWDVALLADAIVHGPWGQKVRQRFTDSRIEELEPLSIFYDHASTHDPKVWEAHSVPELIWPEVAKVEYGKAT